MKQQKSRVDQVVDEIISELTLAERVSVADMGDNEFRLLELAMGKLVRFKLDQLDFVANKELMKDCIDITGESLNEGDAAAVILKKIWENLRETHRLRVLK